MLTARSCSSSAKLCVASSAMRLSNALSVRRCAPPQIAIALRRTVWLLSRSVGVSYSKLHVVHGEFRRLVEH